MKKVDEIIRDAIVEEIELEVTKMTDQIQEHVRSKVKEIVARVVVRLDSTVDIAQVAGRINITISDKG